MAISPQYANSPLIGFAEISIANPTLDGTGEIVDLVVGSENGDILEAIEVKAISTTTIGMIRLFYKKSGSAFWKLFKEIEVEAITPGSNIKTFETPYLFDSYPLTIPPGDSIGVSTEKGEAFNIYAFGGKF